MNESRIAVAAHDNAVAHRAPVGGEVGDGVLKRVWKPVERCAFQTENSASAGRRLLSHCATCTSATSLLFTFQLG